MNKNGILSLLGTAGAVLLLAHCNSSSQFGYPGLDELLTDADPTAEGTLVDTDGDGIVDTIEIPGEPPIPFEPPVVPTPGVNPTPPPLRSDEGACIPVGTNIPVFSITNRATITAADVGSAETIVLNGAGSGGTTTVDLNGLELKRIIVNQSGNTNTVYVRDTVMTEGFCNDMSGGNNTVVLEATSSAAEVDLEGGTGGNNTLAVLLVPADAIRYSLQGNDHCICSPIPVAPDDYEVEKRPSNTNDHDDWVKTDQVCSF